MLKDAMVAPAHHLEARAYEFLCSTQNVSPAVAPICATPEAGFQAPAEPVNMNGTVGCLKSLVGRILGAKGYRISRVSDSPKEEFLGLRSLPIRTVIDVGANVGQFARVASKAFSSATIYCFEPQPAAHKRLAAWAQTSNGRIVPFETALGANEGTLDLIVHVDHDPSSSFLQSTSTLEATYPFTTAQGKTSVPVTTLDTVVRSGRVRLEPDTLVKLDVQGYEDRVIAGAQETLSKARAVITEANLDELYEGQATFEGIVRNLAGLGFRYAGNLDQVHGADGHVVYVDAVFLR